MEEARELPLSLLPAGMGRANRAMMPLRLCVTALLAVAGCAGTPGPSRERLSSAGHGPGGATITTIDAWGANSFREYYCVAAPSPLILINQARCCLLLEPPALADPCSCESAIIRGQRGTMARAHATTSSVAMLVTPRARCFAQVTLVPARTLVPRRAARAAPWPRRTPP